MAGLGIRNPLLIGIGTPPQPNNYNAGGTLSQLGEPTEIEISNGVTAYIEGSGARKTAVASTGDRSITAPASNTFLFENLINNYFPGEQISRIISQEPAPEPASNKTPQSQPAEGGTARPPEGVPLDPRLVFHVDPSAGTVSYSFGADFEIELVDGFVIKDPGGADAKVMANDPAIDTSNFKEFYGVPSLMNPNAYINLQAGGGKGNNKYIIDQENQPRFYDKTVNPSQALDSSVGASKTPTTTNIINWASDGANNNRYKFPYKYQDFVFCKWWQKIPNNYMITLRRYPFPVSDSVTSGEEVRREVAPDKLQPVATMITFLGEEAGNKISTIVGPIETGLKWKDIKADVWEVTANNDFGDVNNPAPGLAKVLGFLTKGADGVKGARSAQSPVDPYTNGPYINKILGPVNVITQTKARERGLEFKHEISLVFEYSLRSIGGINTKAAALDILSNTMVMCSASAAFWGGMNRFMPQAGEGKTDPFLGGAAGRKAWMQGNPEGFFNALKEQFNSAFKNVADFFSKISQDPIGGLKDIAMGGAKEFMKLTSTSARGTVSGLHSLLTGAPVGEWHLQVGSPFNPIMMIGNLICTGVKLEFSDELGPDDFPTELKATITLEHGMPRDRDGIESMFNKGGGRLYALPKGYQKSLYSSSQSANIDQAGNVGGPNQVSQNQAGRGGFGSRRALLSGSVVNRNQRPDIIGADVAYDRYYSYANLANSKTIRSVQAGLYAMGTVEPKGNYFPPAEIKQEEQVTKSTKTKGRKK